MAGCLGTSEYYDQGHGQRALAGSRARANAFIYLQESRLITYAKNLAEKACECLKGWCHWAAWLSVLVTGLDLYIVADTNYTPLASYLTLHRMSPAISGNILTPIITCKHPRESEIYTVYDSMDYLNSADSKGTRSFHQICKESNL